MDYLKNIRHMLETTIQGSSIDISALISKLEDSREALLRTRPSEVEGAEIIDYLIVSLSKVDVNELKSDVVAEYYTKLTGEEQVLTKDLPSYDDLVNFSEEGHELINEFDKKVEKSITSVISMLDNMVHNHLELVYVK